MAFRKVQKNRKMSIKTTVIICRASK